MNRKLIVGSALALACALLFWWLWRPAKTSDRSPKRDLVVLIQAPPLTLDPVATVELDSAFVGNAAHAPLVRFDGHGKIVPVLAREISVATDAMSATVKLRDGCRFWDGSPVRAKDVEASLSRLQHSQNPMKFVVSRIQKFQIISDLELEVDFSSPEPEFPLRVAHLQASITKAESEESPKQAYGRQIIGAGGWIPEDFQEGVRYQFRVNPGFLDHGNATSLAFLVKSETQARLSSFQSKECQIVRLRGPELREMLESTNGVDLNPRPSFEGTAVHAAPASDGSAVMINWSHPALSSVPPEQRTLLVRALSDSLPRSTLALTLMAAEPFLSVVPSSALPHQANNINTAPQDSPFRLASPIEVELLAANDAASRELATLIAPALGRSGITVKLRFTDIGSLIKAILQKEHQFALTYFEMPVPGPEGWLMFFDDSNSFSAFGQPLAGVRNGIEHARGILDAKQRSSAWNDVVQDVNNRQIGWIPLFSRQTVVVTRPDVSGLFIDICGTPVWTNLGFRE